MPITRKRFEPIFIELRIWSPYKERFKELNSWLMQYGSERIKVPHVALYGGAKTNHFEEVKRAIADIARNYDLISFETKYFGYFNNPDKKWITVKIQPSEELKSIRWQIAQALFSVASPKAYDRLRDYDFHVSIGQTKNPKTFRKLLSIIKSLQVPDMHLYLLRITVIGDVKGESQKIKCEYDLMQKRWLTRREAKNPREYGNTLSILRTKLGKTQVSLQPQSTWEKLINRFRDLFK